MKEEREKVKRQVIRVQKGKEKKLTQRRRIKRHRGGGCPLLQMKVGLRVKSVAQASAQQLSWDAGPRFNGLYSITSTLGEHEAKGASSSGPGGSRVCSYRDWTLWWLLVQMFIGQVSRLTHELKGLQVLSLPPGVDSTELNHV